MEGTIVENGFSILDMLVWIGSTVILVKNRRFLHPSKELDPQNCSREWTVGVILVIFHPG